MNGSTRTTTSRRVPIASLRSVRRRSGDAVPACVAPRRLSRLLAIASPCRAPPVACRSAQSAAKAPGPSLLSQSQTTSILASWEVGSTESQTHVRHLVADFQFARISKCNNRISRSTVILSSGP